MVVPDGSRTVVESPVGPITLVARDGALVGLHFEAPDAPVDDRPPSATARAGGAAERRVLDAAAEQLDEYFTGGRTAFDLPLQPAGTPFQQRVWAALRTIGYGETRSYGQIAAQIGQPTASRAVGLANGRNPVSIVVPCHRVIGSTGTLTGYGGGIHRKRRLLDLERGALLLDDG